ncbi:pyrroline-5-carboxylate reductase family protein [Streptomyces apocyni]|uniref:pyrroline-5-carboxylate reductase family protein n=1 Tax=Streptomyces apocyni TaxID=2654677 RepID=UPI0012EA6B93|nr:pyrroline-5-carboxylate reductase dimerization domain-containing protein [Streptomyces apocyni]
MTITTVSFIGCGRITRAMVEGLVTSGWPAQNLRGVSRGGKSARALAEGFGTVATATVAEAVERADLVVLAVDPPAAAEVLREIRASLGGRQLLLSLVASWPADRVAEAVGHGAPVVRAVPNVAVAACAGATVLCAGPGAGPGHLAAVQRLFGRTGGSFLVDEKHMETVSALSGAGPALLAQYARTLADAAAGQGLPARLAEQLTAHALRGTGELLAGTGHSTEDVIDSVASPGGMTRQALETLERSDLPKRVADALTAAVNLSLARMPAREESAPM